MVFPSFNYAHLAVAEEDAGLPLDARDAEGKGSSAADDADDLTSHRFLLS